MPWLRPRAVAPNNVVEGFVTKNVTDPTYGVDLVGYSIAMYAPAAMRPGTIRTQDMMPATPIASPPPQRAMRLYNGDGTYSSVMTVPQAFRGSVSALNPQQSPANRARATWLRS